MDATTRKTRNHTVYTRKAIVTNNSPSCTPSQNLSSEMVFINSERRKSQRKRKDNEKKRKEKEGKKETEVPV